MSKPELKLRMRVNVGDLIAVGPGKIALLEALAETGSITAAARSLAMSYRRAWLLIDELNGAMKKPAVETAQGGAKGGGSRLTPEGEQLVALYRSIENKALAHCARQITDLQRMLR